MFLDHEFPNPENVFGWCEGMQHFQHSVDLKTHKHYYNSEDAFKQKFYMFHSYLALTFGVWAEFCLLEVSERQSDKNNIAK